MLRGESRRPWRKNVAEYYQRSDMQPESRIKYHKTLKVEIRLQGLEHGRNYRRISLLPIRNFWLGPIFSWGLVVPIRNPVPGFAP